jgi:transcriptional antiterminator NusG
VAELKWYVIRAVSGQEKKVKNYIETEVVRQKLEDVVTQVLIPSEKVMEMRNGKKVVRDKNFFPGYIIVNAELNNG